MPYRRRYSRRTTRRRRKPRTFMDRKVSLRQVWSKTKYLASMINSEKKFFDSGADTTIASDAPHIACLTEVIQGDSSVNRDGKSILAKSIQVSGILTMDTVAAAANFRVMIVRDNTYDGAVPTLGVTGTAATDLLENGTLPWSPINKDLQGKYTIVKDMRADLFTVSRFTKQFNIFLNLPDNFHIKYDDGTTERKNNLYIVAFSSLPAASNPPSIKYTSRLRFYDN